MTPRTPAVVVAAVVVMALGLFGMAGQSIIAITTSREGRMAYLAHSIIWKEPPLRTPTELRDGPRGVVPDVFARATAPIPCSFVRPGDELSGDSPKFECRTENGQLLRLKYWNPATESGNREVFATVAATRLMWALGFNAVPSFSISVICQRCPENPMTGDGPVGTRSYAAVLQPWLERTAIVSRRNLDQGWSWRELDEAIGSLPPGDERTRQRTYFDALTLLGVLMQHGDRKPEQQNLYCDSIVDVTQGTTTLDNNGGRWIAERPGASACQQAAVVVFDVGATFGGGGHWSRESTAKMNLDQWRRKSVFLHTGDDTCRGRLSSSVTAGADGEPDPVISEEGRRFLAERLHVLTHEHVRALFEAAHVEQLAERKHNTHAPSSDAVEAWAGAFEEKVREIDARTCAATLR